MSGARAEPGQAAGGPCGSESAGLGGEEMLSPMLERVGPLDDGGAGAQAGHGEGVAARAGVAEALVATDIVVLVVLRLQVVGLSGAHGNGGELINLPLTAAGDKSSPYTQLPLPTEDKSLAKKPAASLSTPSSMPTLPYWIHAYTNAAATAKYLTKPEGLLTYALPKTISIREK
ncbi:hypothetical protein FRC12_024581 [Ceratobasidium sp. 428]|nr:hypothetical protein FRC12_024581 [Ceratobasidium sp. 428]